MAKPAALITGGASHVICSGRGGISRVRDEEIAWDAVEALVHRFGRLDAEYPMPE